MEILQEILEYNLFEYKNFELTVLSVLSVVFIFILTRIFLWGFGQAINRNLAKKKIADPGRRHALLQIAKYLAYTLAIVMSLNSIGFDLSLLMTGSAALLVGIGFGLQYTFNDFISGIVILFDGSIEVDDIVQVGDLIGRIKAIGIRATTVDTRDAISVIVPNSKLTQENVINWSHHNKKTRFKVAVGVAYGSNVKEVMATLLRSAAIHPEVMNDPQPKVRFQDFGDSALLFEVLFWTQNTFNVEFIKSDIRVAIDEAFRQKGIQIPFPQRDLHIISDKRERIVS